MSRLSLLVRLACAAAIAAVAVPAGSGRAAAASGEAAFDQECGDCHSLKAGRNKKGPSLAGIIGRRPASIADFDKYSDGMKALSTPWTSERIAAYVRNPRAYVKGSTMKYDGLSDEAAVAAIVGYLAAGK